MYFLLIVVIFHCYVSLLEGFKKMEFGVDFLMDLTQKRRFVIKF